MTTIKERIELATQRLGKTRAAEILRNAERKLGAGHFLTLAQQANHLETAIEEQGITAVWTGGSRVQQKKPDDERSFDEWMAEFDSLTDPIARTEYYRRNISAIKAARVKALYPSPYVLKPRRK